MTMNIVSQNKPHVNVGTIGHIDHGKSTLTAAIVAVLAREGLATVKTYQEVTKGGIFRDGNKTVTIIVSHTEYESRNRHYTHVDCPGHADYVKNMIAGAAQMDGAVLVVAADSGPSAQTREHILLAKQVNVPSMVVFLNKVDLVEDPELIDLVELEVCEMLTRYGYDGSKVPVVRGQARAALEHPEDPERARCIWELLEAMDRHIPIPKRKTEKPFLLPIEGVYSIRGRGTVVTGKIEQGVIGVGDKVRVVGLETDGLETTCTAIKMFQRHLEKAEAGQNVGLLLRGVKKGEVQRGQMIAAPASVSAGNRFRAQVYVLKHEEGGRHTAFFPNYEPQFFFQTCSVTGKILALHDKEGAASKMCMPGDHVLMDVELGVGKSVAMSENARFAIREGTRTVGQGMVVEVLA